MKFHPQSMKTNGNQYARFEAIKQDMVLALQTKFSDIEDTIKSIKRGRLVDLTKEIPRKMKSIVKGDTAEKKADAYHFGLIFLFSRPSILIVICYYGVVRNR